MTKSPFWYRDQLWHMAATLGVSHLADKVLNNTRFLSQSGSLRDIAHHNGHFGLLRHTWEVCSLVLQTAAFYEEEHVIDLKELFLSALFHDYGKVWDYVYDEEAKAWADTPSKHRRRIHHIQRSAIEWEMIAREMKVKPECAERVTHNILSHHGQREWGSSVAPYTREAWILHLCDGLSARIDDCDRLDMITVNKRNPGK